MFVLWLCQFLLDRLSRPDLEWNVRLVCSLCIEELLSKLHTLCCMLLRLDSVGSCFTASVTFDQSGRSETGKSVSGCSLRIVKF